MKLFHITFAVDVLDDSYGIWTSLKMVKCQTLTVINL
jgi:hypothetical protein